MLLGYLGPKYLRNVGNRKTNKHGLIISIVPILPKSPPCYRCEAVPSALQKVNRRICLNSTVSWKPVTKNIVHYVDNL